MDFKSGEIAFINIFSQVIGIGLTGLNVEKVTDGNLRKIDQYPTGIYTGYSLQLTLIIATSIMFVLLCF